MLPPPPLPAEPTCSLSVLPSTIEEGESSTLSWETTDATSLTINQGIGEVTLPSGSQEVSPLETITYTGTVMGPGGSNTCSVTLTVGPLVPPPPEEEIPECSLSVLPSTIEEGESSTLSWETTDATSLTINQGIGEVTLPSGSQEVSPLETITYTGTVIGPGGSNT
ncbi:unnamed protein product, partial [marine sediment metagenome]